MTKIFYSRIYLYIFFYDLIFAYPVYNLLFSRSGLSSSEISILLAWWALVAVVFEIPSGIIADKWSKKWLIVLAPVFKGLCYLLWASQEETFWIFALGFFMWGLGSTLITGTYQSYVYDSMADENEENKFAKVLSRIYFFKKIGIGAGLILGGLIASISLDLAFYLSVIPLVGSFVIGLSFRERKKLSQVEDEKSFSYLAKSFRDIRSSKILQYLFLTIVVLGLFGNLEEYDQLYFELVDLPISLFGVAAFIPFWASALVESNSYRLKDRKSIFVSLPLLASVLLIITGFFPSQYTIIALIISYIIISPLNVLSEAFIQREIPSKNRATIVSIGNFSKQLMGIGFYLVFAFLIKLTQLEVIYIFGAIVLVMFAVYSFINLIRNNVEEVSLKDVKSAPSEI